MDDTDFDALCEGAPPAEAKQLRKLLADWCNGQENSFPVQLVLLTRAQFRAAATVPLAINEAQKLLDLKLAEQRQQVTALVKTYEQTASAKAGELKTIVADHAANATKTVAEMRGHLGGVEKVAQRIRSEMEGGAEKWKDATTDFERVTKRLTQLCADLQARPWRSHWVLVVLLLIATFAAGYAIGQLRLR
jgi:hypothetical protein